MSPETINRRLANDPQWRDTDNAAAKKAFIRAMNNRWYGTDTLIDAWYFFLEGWNSAETAKSSET